MISKISQQLKEYFFLGLLTLGPLAITIWIFIEGFQIIDNFFPESVKPFNGLGIVFFFSLIIFAGLLTKTFLGNIFTTLSDAILSRLPLVRSLYALIKQVSNALLSGDSQSSFKRVVYISFLTDDAKLLAFVTGEIPQKDQLVLFVPTAPNPTSGYTIMYPKNKVEDANMTVDQALKVIVSCGSSLSLRNQKTAEGLK
ncbi:DUF502 domain-containing protein [bacterium]|nr:DUF502 domain-containing protein [bacterium]